MDLSRSGDFLFTVCQIGAETALKKEIQREHPELRFAYSRPGFVTFKSLLKNNAVLPLDFTLQSVFARAYGNTVGRIIAEPDSEIGRIDLLVHELRAFQAGEMARLHVIERDHYVPGEEPPHYVSGVYARRIEERLHQMDEMNEGGLFYRDSIAVPGDLVIDVVLVNEQEWWLGLHRHTDKHSPFAGGRPEIEFPPEAPSRAYLKIEEAIRWSEIPFRVGDHAVEIGSAPGGASYALLRRGITVTGIDPGEMDPVVLNMSTDTAAFWHIQKSVSLVNRDDLPKKVDWLLLDMNVAPGVSLFAVERMVGLVNETLKGLLLTVKLNDWSMADQVPSMLEYVKSMGMVHVQARQLFHNRQEFVIYALSSKGLMSRRPTPNPN